MNILPSKQIFALTVPRTMTTSPDATIDREPHSSFPPAPQARQDAPTQGVLREIWSAPCATIGDRRDLPCALFGRVGVERPRNLVIVSKDYIASEEAEGFKGTP